MSWKLIKQISGNSHSNGGVDMTLNNQPVEVEGGELLFKNTDTGAMAVTPKRDSQMLLPHVYSNSPFLDQYIGNLKHVGKYAKDGIEVPLSGTVSRIKEDNDMRRDLIFRFPGIESAYGYFASDLGLIHDPDFKAHNIEFMVSGNPGNTYDLEDGKYIYGNPNPERDNVIYNDNARKGDIMLDVISHSPLLKQTKEYQNVSNAIMDENRDDIDYFYEMDVASGRFGDGRARWVENYVDGKIRAYMSQTYKDLDLDDATRADYELEIVSPKSKAAIQKYHDNVLTKVDPIYHNNRLIEAQKYQDGLEHRESVIRGLERSIKAEYGLVVGDPLKQKKDVPNRQINPDVLYGYTPEEEKFLKKHYEYAKKIGEAQGIDPLILLTQVATETSFNDGNYANNNIFGIKSNKDKSGQPIGNYKFERTQEWMDDDKQDHMFLKPVLNKTYYEDRKQWLYDVEEPFVKFDSLEEGYEGVVDFWEKNSRYKSALEKKDNPEEFFNELGKSGYSSSSKYGETLQKNYKKVSAYVKYKMEDGGIISIHPKEEKPVEPKKPIFEEKGYPDWNNYSSTVRKNNQAFGSTSGTRVVVTDKTGKEYPMNEAEYAEYYNWLNQTRKKPKLEQGGVIPEEPKKPWWMPDTFDTNSKSQLYKEPTIVRDNVVQVNNEHKYQQTIKTN